MLCCDSCARNPRICITDVNGRCAGHCTDRAVVSHWPRASPGRSPQSRTFSSDNGDMNVKLAVLLCTSREHRCCGGGGSGSNGNGNIYNTREDLTKLNVIRDGSEQRLLEAAALTASMTYDETCCSRHQQSVRNTRSPSFHHVSSSKSHTMCLWPTNRPHRASVTCDFTAEGSSETTSTDEYDMQILKSQEGKNSIPKRVRVQYRVNSQRVLQSRKRIIRLLVVVLLTFVVCVLPFHLKFILMFWNIYPTPTTRMDILSPLAFVMLYMNSALNPILFWVFSDSFRRSLRDSFRRTCWC